MQANWLTPHAYPPVNTCFGTLALCRTWRGSCGMPGQLAPRRPLPPQPQRQGEKLQSGAALRWRSSTAGGGWAAREAGGGGGAEWPAVREGQGAAGGGGGPKGEGPHPAAPAGDCYESTASCRCGAPGAGSGAAGGGGSCKGRGCCGAAGGKEAVPGEPGSVGSGSLPSKHGPASAPPLAADSPAAAAKARAAEGAAAAAAHASDAGKGGASWGSLASDGASPLCWAVGGLEAAATDHIPAFHSIPES